MFIFKFLFFSIFCYSISIYGSVYANSQWQYSAGNYESHRYSSLGQINNNNIMDLDETWNFDSKKNDNKNVVQSTPIYIDNKLIVVDIYGGVYALNPINGKRIWFAQLKPPAGRRGITAIDGKNPKIYVSSKKLVIELNAKIGKVVKEFNSGLSLLPPIINKNKIFIATLKYGVKAYDIKTIELLWNFSLKKNNVNPRIWSGFSYDPITKSLFVVTSNPGGLYGANRIKHDLSVSLVSINSDTGIKNWHFQHIRHDLWDFDLVENPMIFSIKKNDVFIRVVTALSKTGDVIYLKAKDGSLVFPKGLKK